MKKIALVTNAGEASGVGHYVQALHPLLARAGEERGFAVESFRLDDTRLWREETLLRAVRPLPGILHHKTINWLRLGKYVQAEVRSQKYSLVHLTNQTLSFLTMRDVPTVITVHDIIELITPQSRLGGLAARALCRNLGRATHLACVSNYTAQSLQEHLGISKEKITVIHNGVSSAFHPLENFPQTIGYATLRRELRLAPEDTVVLYVGSEHPRKNVGVALTAFAECQKRIPNLVFVKVGDPGLRSAREQTLQSMEALGIRERVRFVSKASLPRLNELYNLARVFVFPSSFEGFGLPPLQALAAGTPVVAANSSSLPEILGDAATLISPQDTSQVAEAILAILENAKHAAQLREKGLARAQAFSWENAAAQLVGVYQRIWR